MTEPLGFIHRDYSIFINNESDLIMKRLYLWVFFCTVSGDFGIKKDGDE